MRLVYSPPSTTGWLNAFGNCAHSDMGKLVVAQQTTEAAIDSLYDPVL